MLGEVTAYLESNLI